MTTDEDEISSLYQQAKNQEAKKQGPPAHLDKAILKAAHEAVEHVSPVEELSVVKGPFSGGWRATASIAAVLIITVILVPLVEREEPVPAFDMPASDTQVDGLQTKQVFKGEIAELEVKQLRKEKTKKRVMQDASKVQLEERMQLDQVQAFPESDSIDEQAVARQNIAAMRSASPAPASATISMAESADNSTQQEVKEEADFQEIQPSQPKVMAFEDTVLVEELSPKQWLAKIRQLLDKGEVKTAEKELDAFKLQYPDEKIDPEILQSIQNLP